MRNDVGSIEQIFENKINKLAAIQHEIWVHWQSYLHSQCVKNEDGSLTIPSQLVGHWEKQINTNYDELSKEEKASDIEQVAKLKSIVIGMLLEAQRIK